MKNVLRAMVRLLFKPLLSPLVPLAVQRYGAKASGVLSRPPRGTQATKLEMNGVPARRYRTHGSENGKALLFLHGGAYVLGGPASHGALAARLGEASGTDAYLADYRLAPEHPYPAALDDALAAYRWLLQEYPAHGIVIAGDSAGGNLSLATAMAIRDAGLPPPAALALISPWLDLTHSGASAMSRAARDPMLSTAWLRASARHYAGKLALDDPRLSPLFGSLEDLPPMLVHVGSEEVVLSDSERLATSASVAGVDLELRVFDGLWHDFQLLAGQLAEADESVAELGRFLRERMAESKAAAQDRGAPQRLQKTA
jgi:acetyl esterase/lipase